MQTPTSRGPAIWKRYIRVAAGGILHACVYELCVGCPRLVEKFPENVFLYGVLCGLTDVTVCWLCRIFKTYQLTWYIFLLCYPMFNRTWVFTDNWKMDWSFPRLKLAIRLNVGDRTKHDSQIAKRARFWDETLRTLQMSLSSFKSISRVD